MLVSMFLILLALVVCVVQLVMGHWWLAFLDFIIALFMIENLYLRSKIDQFRKMAKEAKKLIERMTTDEVDEIAKREIKKE